MLPSHSQGLDVWLRRGHNGCAALYAVISVSLEEEHVRCTPGCVQPLQLMVSERRLAPNLGDAPVLPGRSSRGWARLSSGLVRRAAARWRHSTAAHGPGPRSRRDEIGKCRDRDRGVPGSGSGWGSRSAGVGIGIGMGLPECRGRVRRGPALLAALCAAMPHSRWRAALLSLVSALNRAQLPSWVQCTSQHCTKSPPKKPQETELRNKSLVFALSFQDSGLLYKK